MTTHHCIDTGISNKLADAQAQELSTRVYTIHSYHPNQILLICNELILNDLLDLLVTSNMIQSQAT